MCAMMMMTGVVPDVMHRLRRRRGRNWRGKCRRAERKS
jgi:hypothetical protein